MKKTTATSFNLKEAREIADAYCSLTGISVRLYTDGGAVVYEKGSAADYCGVCAATRLITGEQQRCAAVHLHGMQYSEQFGGRYIYFCPSGMTYFSSPIIVGGKRVGAFVCGPVLMLEVEDYLEGDLMADRLRTPEDVETMRRAVGTIPQIEPEKMEHLSKLLFACSVYVSDSVQELLIIRDGNHQQDLISDYIQQFKRDESKQNYPVRQEQELLAAVTEGDALRAEHLLDEVLACLFYSYGSREVIDGHIAELVTLLSRSAIHGGADAEQTLEKNTRYLSQIRMLRQQDALTQWLHAALKDYMSLQVRSPDTKHCNQIHEALRFMRLNFMKRLTLETVAEHVSYSPSYFSKLFKQETGQTFRGYLNYLRIEKSKTLLLTSNVPISTICSVVAFEDQSYFCKVFKRIEGVTPDHYRKRNRRIQADRERSAQAPEAH